MPEIYDTQIDHPEPLESDSFESETSELLEQGVTQKTTRICDNETDSLVGLFRCDFEPGQTRYILNIPIHPAMHKTPGVESVVFADGFRIRTTNCEKFGVRLELVDNHPTTESKSIFLETIISSCKEPTT